MEPSTRSYATAFAKALARVPPGSDVLVLCHNDADGLAAGTLLVRCLETVSWRARARLIGRFESPWSAHVRAEMNSMRPGLIIATDLGIRPEPIAPGVLTVFIDHHVPQGTPDAAVVISGYGQEPTPSSSLLAYWSVQDLVDPADIVWIAALGLIGDYGEKAPFSELREARALCNAKVLREATSLINAPRRARTGDAKPAFDLLMKANGPMDVVSGEHPETAILQETKDEVSRELAQARRVAPRVRGEVALIEIRSRCQIHPLVAQSWTGRLRDKVVIVANRGFREGYVHFAVRTTADRDLIEFLRARAPVGAEQNSEYGQGHRRATGGALTDPDWMTFLEKLGLWQK